MPSSLLINMLLKGLARARKQEKENKVIKIAKEKEKVILFAYDLIVCIENSKEFKYRI